MKRKGSKKRGGKGGAIKSPYSPFMAHGKGMKKRGKKRK